MSYIFWFNVKKYYLLLSGTTVNRGPMEMATVFLAPPQYDKNTNNRSPEVSDECSIQPPPPRLQNKLRLCFKDFSKK